MPSKDLFGEPIPDNRLTKPDWGVLGGRLLAFYAKSTRTGKERKEAEEMGHAEVEEFGQITVVLSVDALDILGDDLGVALADMVRGAVKGSEADQS